MAVPAIIFFNFIRFTPSLCSKLAKRLLKDTIAKRKKYKLEIVNRIGLISRYLKGKSTAAKLINDGRKIKIEIIKVPKYKKGMLKILTFLLRGK